MGGKRYWSLVFQASHLDKELLQNIGAFSIMELSIFPIESDYRLLVTRPPLTAYLFPHRQFDKAPDSKVYQ